MNPIPLLATILLMVCGGYLLSRQRWWIGTEFFAASLVIGLWTGPTTEALFAWAALAGFVLLTMVLLKRSASRES